MRPALLLATLLLMTPPTDATELPTPPDAARKPHVVAAPFGAAFTLLTRPLLPMRSRRPQSIGDLPPWLPADIGLVADSAAALRGGTSLASRLGDEP